MSNIMILKETQKIGDAVSISTQNIFPLHSVVPKRPESPYGEALFFEEIQFFSFWEKRN